MNKLKMFLSVAAVAALALFSLTQPVGKAHAEGFGKENFQKQFYFAHTALGKKSGFGAANAHAIATDTTFWAIPAGTVIEKVYMVIDTAITGTTALSVGDTDGASSFVPTGSLTLGTPGMYGWSADKEGAYLQSATVFSGPSPLPTPTSQVLPAAKYYSAVGKYLTVTNTTANTAGAFRLMVYGYNVAL